MNTIYSAFRKVYPNGKMEQRITSHDNGSCMAEARVYEDKNDSEQAFLANGFAFRLSDAGENFMEEALLAALKCAILATGISLVKEPDSPAREGKPRTGSANRKKEAASDKAAPPELPADNADNEEGEAAGVEESGTGIPTVIVPAPEGEAAPVSELLETMTRQEAEAVCVPARPGETGPQTMKDVALQRPASLKWYAEEYRGPDSRIPAAARILLGAAYRPA